MVGFMEKETLVKLTGGVNQSGVRDHNERLILTVLQRHGPTPGADVARLTGLSPQTVSIILRKLEKDEILRRGTAIRGKVGKPSIPMELNPDGVLSVGMKIGRRSADLLLIDFAIVSHIAVVFPASILILSVPAFTFSISRSALYFNLSSISFLA